MTDAVGRVRSRRSGATLEQPGGGTFATTYGYDTSGRLNSVVSPAGSFGYTYATVTLGGYSYVPGEIAQVSLPGGPYVGQTFDNVGRLLTTSLKTEGGTVLNSHAYLNNAGNQRYKQTLTDGGYVDYAYDNLGQLDTALTKTSGGAAVGGQQFDYGYDAGWNLTTLATGTGTTTYTANDRNQATADSSSLYSRSYDANGNYTGGSNGTVGAFTYLYDDENQLVSIATDAVYTPAGSRWKTDFTYDGRGRLRKRVDSTWNTGTSAWQVSGESRYVYDGMLLLQERSSGNLPLVSYTRGLDLSGSLAGAGGIGGLLARSVHSATSPYPLSTSVFYHADGNGNVTALVDGAGTLQATYKYDPYGRTLSTTGGSVATANLLRFSSKPWVQHNLAFTDRGLYYYTYRFYDPNTAKWVNRDPVEEEGGINLYGFVENNPIDGIDSSGLATTGIGTPGIGWVFMDEAAQAAAAAAAARAAARAALVAAAASSVSVCPAPKDPCKGLRAQVNKHIRKIKEYAADPDGNDHRGLFKLPKVIANPALRDNIIDGRLKGLKHDLDEYLKQLEACEKKNGLK